MNQSKLTIWILIIALALTQCNCAMIFQGGRQDIPVTSEPSGATILLDARSVGQTPKTISVPRTGSHTITIKKAGYRRANYSITKNVGGWFWVGLLLFWGPLELLSFANGGAYNLNPKAIDAVLENQ